MMKNDVNLAYNLLGKDQITDVVFIDTLLGRIITGVTCNNY